MSFGFDGLAVRILVRIPLRRALRLGLNLQPAPKIGSAECSQCDYKGGYPQTYPVGVGCRRRARGLVTQLY